MNVLALDTATEALGLALSAQGGSWSLTLRAGLKHGQNLLPRLEALLQEAGLAPPDLDLLVCGIGPGSFTGVRIGLATAQGLALAAGCPLLGVSGLDGLAWRFRSFPGAVVVALPTLRRNHHCAVYRDGRLEGGYLELPLGEVALRLDPELRLLLTGAAAEALAARLGPGERLVAVDRALPLTDPESLLGCGMDRYRREGPPRTDPLPLYLRKSEAEARREGLAP